MAQVGDLIYVVMTPRGHHYEEASYHAKLPEAQEAIFAKYPAVLRQHCFWNNDGQYCRLLMNEPFPHPLPYVVRRELT